MLIQNYVENISYVWNLLFCMIVEDAKNKPHLAPWPLVTSWTVSEGSAAFMVSSGGGGLFSYSTSIYSFTRLILALYGSVV